MQPSPALTPRAAAAAALASSAGLALTYAALVRTSRGRVLDDRAARATSRRTALRRTSKALLRPYRPVAYAATVSACGLAGLATRGPVRTACASAALVGTVVSAEVLKAALDRPVPSSVDRSVHPWPENSYPSGHTAGVAGLGAMALVLAPAYLPAVAIAGTAATAAVGAATVAARWHRPSDVVGSLLLGVAWSCVGLAAAEAVDAA